MRYALLAIWIGAVSTLSAYASGLWMNNKSFTELSAHSATGRHGF